MFSERELRRGQRERVQESGEDEEAGSSEARSCSNISISCYCMFLYVSYLCDDLNCCILLFMFYRSAEARSPGELYYVLHRTVWRLCMLHIFIYTYIHICVYVYIYIYIYIYILGRLGVHEIPGSRSLSLPESAPLRDICHMLIMKFTDTVISVIINIISINIEMFHIYYYHYYHYYHYPYYHYVYC